MRCHTINRWCKTPATLLPAMLVALFATTAFGQGGTLTVGSIEKQVFDLVNQQRENANLGKASNDPTRLHLYQPNAKLFATAGKYAEFMARNDKVEHQLDGRTPSQRAAAEGYPSFVLENIGGGQPSPQAIVQAWMKSQQGHRITIMNSKDTEIGVGHANSRDGTNVWVLLSGRSAEANNAPRLVVNTAQPQQQPPQQQPQTFNVTYLNRTSEAVTVYRLSTEGKLVSTNTLGSGLAQSFPYLPGERSLVQHAFGKVLRDGLVNKSETIVFDASSLQADQQTQNPPPQPGVLKVSQEEKSLLDQINAVRTSINLAAFKPNTKLFIAARNHASHMARVEQMNHVLDGKTPSDRGRALGYPSEVDEVFNGGANDAQRVVGDWLAIPRLAAKLLSADTTEIGIGFARSPDMTKVWNITLGSSAEANNPPTLQLQ